MNPTTIALSVLVLAAVCSADSERRRDRTDCSSSGCAEEKRKLSAGEQALHSADKELSTAHHPPAAPRPAHAPSRDSHQQDSSSPLLKVNFWLTLLISALVAALLS